MAKKQQNQPNATIVGLLFIFIGSLFLAAQIFPGFASLLNFARIWPLFIFAIGGVFLFNAWRGNSGLAVPGVIISTIGGILLYHTIFSYSLWQLWLLMPGAVGVGIWLQDRLSKRPERNPAVYPLLTISTILFLSFTILPSLAHWWPLGLIALGVYLLIRNFRRSPS